MKAFELGGISVPLDAALDLSQSLRFEVPRTDHRMHGGALKRQTGGWKKINTIINGGGWYPAGLDGLDYEGPLTLKCGAPLAINSASNVIVISANRRSDTGYQPAGFAFKGGNRIPVDFGGVSTDTYTLTAVSGADYYQIEYFPQISVFANEPVHDKDVNQVRYSWTLEAKEI